MHLQKRRKPGSNPPQSGHHIWGAMPTASLFSHCLGGAAVAHFHPLESSPGIYLPSRLAGRWKKGRSVRQIPRHTHTHTRYSSLLSAPLPAPTPPFSPALSPTPVSHPRMAHGSPGTCRDGCSNPRLLLKEPIKAELLLLCFAFPSLPSSLPGCWKRENGGSEVGNPG